MKRPFSFSAVLTGAMLGAAFWFVDCGVDALVFKEGTLAGQFFSPAPVEIWVRSFVLAVFIGFSVYSQSVINKLRKAREALTKANVELASKAEEWGASLLKESAERRRVEEALADATQLAETERAKTDAIIEGLGVGIIIQDLNYRVLYENELQQRTIGNHVGEYCYRAYEGREDICESCPMVRSIADGGIHREEKEITAPEGTKHYELITSPLRDSLGNIIGGVKVVKDITRLKKMEERILHGYRMETIGTLSAGISHEYNNIISIIRGACEFLEEDIEEGSELRRYVAVINTSTERAATLTRGLLTYSRKHDYNPAPVNVNEIMVRIEELLRRIVGADVELKMELTSGDPIVMADANHLEQAIINLTTNAKDAMPGGGTITISTGLVEMDVESVTSRDLGEPGRYVLVTVADTGTGIEEHAKKKLFEPFFTTKEVGRGTGLGLSMVYGIIRKHGGHIDLRSESGKGATFLIYLPIHEPEG